MFFTQFRKRKRGLAKAKAYAQDLLPVPDLGEKTPEEDFLLAEELISDDKERAEHIMLVDLIRNDVGRISAYGTMKVEEFMVIENYSHVMHIVSEAQGEIAQGQDAYDVIIATFPGQK